MTGGCRSDCIITSAQGWCSVLAGPAPQRLASPPFASVAGLAHPRRYWAVQRGQQRCRVRHCAKNTALHMNHAERRLMMLQLRRRTAVAQHQTFKAAIVGFAQCGMHANVGGDAADDQIADTATVQNQLKVGGVKGAFAGFINNHFIR